jgi:hypothetical protein
MFVKDSSTRAVTCLCGKALNMRGTVFVKFFLPKMQGKEPRLFWKSVVLRLKGDSPIVIETCKNP